MPFWLGSVNQPLLGKAEYINIFLTTVTTAEQARVQTALAAWPHRA